MDKRHPVNLNTFKEQRKEEHNRTKCNRMLLEWLSDDKDRKDLFSAVNDHLSGQLVFDSRDVAPRQPADVGLDRPRPPPVVGHAQVTLVTDRHQIIKILRENAESYSNRVYAELGDGSFMLALDPNKASTAHAAQRTAFSKTLPSKPLMVDLAHAACEAAAVMAFRVPDFDLADFAEQAALRCCQLWMGYPTRDFPLLETTLRVAYRALVHQVMERHFVTDPVLIPEAKVAMGRLLTRTAALIDGFAAGDDDVTKGWEDPARPPGFTPMLKQLGESDTELNGEQLAVVALGAAIGTVGNVQAAVCIAVKALFENPTALREAQLLAAIECADRPTKRGEHWQRLIVAPLRTNPPIPFLPRVKINADGTVREYLLALGGGAATSKLSYGVDDPLIWGLSPPVDKACQGGESAPHWCAGRALAWPLIVEAVRQVMSLPDLAQALDPENGRVKGLEKRHGFACVSYPLTHRRDRRLAQTSLNVAMRIRPPRQDNADRLRQVIRAGAPRIEQALRASRHVHFAWFELIEQDTVLVLHTVYDGPFGAYLQHFARRAGDLFDVLFEYIEDPPPMPVAKFPVEFEAHLLRYNRPPAMGYFFSAYPSSEVARIVRQEGRGP